MEDWKGVCCERDGMKVEFDGLLKEVVVEKYKKKKMSKTCTLEPNESVTQQSVTVEYEI